MTGSYNVSLIATLICYCKYDLYTPILCQKFSQEMLSHVVLVRTQKSQQANSILYHKISSSCYCPFSIKAHPSSKYNSMCRNLHILQKSVHKCAHYVVISEVVMAYMATCVLIITVIQKLFQPPKAGL